MQYHWVVMYDQETGTFEIDWDMTYGVLLDDSGVAFDPAYQQWVHFDSDDKMNQTYETLSIHLENSLDKHYTL